MRKADSFVGGIDVCADDGEISWNSIKNAKTQFVMIKATEGSDADPALPCLTDPNFKTNVQEAYMYGLRVGAYHYLTAGSAADAKNQADYFVSQIRTMGNRINFYCGIVVTDWDDSDEMNLYIDICAGIISSAGYMPLVYAPIELLQEFDRLPYDLWLPYYSDDFESLPSMIQKRTVLWQHKPIAVRGVHDEILRSALIHPDVLFDVQFCSAPISYPKRKKPGKQYQEAVEWAIRNGILRSENDEFDLQEDICREELLILLRRFNDLWRASYA